MSQTFSWLDHLEFLGEQLLFRLLGFLGIGVAVLNSPKLDLDHFLCFIFDATLECVLRFLFGIRPTARSGECSFTLSFRSLRLESIKVESILVAEPLQSIVTSVAFLFLILLLALLIQSLEDLRRACHLLHCEFHWGRGNSFLLVVCYRLSISMSPLYNLLLVLVLQKLTEWCGMTLVLNRDKFDCFTTLGGFSPGRWWHIKLSIAFFLRGVRSLVIVFWRWLLWSLWMMRHWSWLGINPRWLRPLAIRLLCTL